MIETLKAWWCNVMHSGGSIERDSNGRINWQCSTCGRWSSNPVSHEDEQQVIDREILGKQ